MSGRAFFCIALVLLVALLARESWSFSQGPNNRNVSVDTRVNVTGSAPEVINMTIPDPITLNANAAALVTCNFTVRDYNGFADINTVRGALFNASSSFGAADNNNTHYTNSSCTQIAGEQGGFLSNYTCSFALRYYAVNGTWNCTGWANDSIGLIGNNSLLTNVSALLALNVTTLIDYGVMNVGDTSGNQTANVTNVGNVPINVSVAGYGQAFGDGLGFVCDYGNLSVGLQHFSANITANYTVKQALSASRAQVFGLTTPKSVNDTAVTNTTYWQLYLNPAENVNGICNGTIVFQAEASG